MTYEFLLQPLLFITAVVFIFYVPGTLLQHAMGWDPKDGLSQATLRLSLGLVIVPIFYHLMRHVGMSNGLMLSLVTPLVAYGVHRFLRLRGVRWDKNDWAVLVLAAMFTVLLLVFSHFGDFGIYDGGTWYKTTHLAESIFHQGLVNALKDSFPPPAIYAAGSTDFSSYHLNMHLQIEGMYRLTGISTDRLVFWYFPALYFLLLFLLPVAFVRKHGGGIVPAAVAGMLVFGTGFSFLPGLFSEVSSSFVWLLFFHPDIYSLFTLNGVIPALIALFVFLLIFPFDDMAESRKYWIVFVLIMVGAYGFKSSMGTQLAGVCIAVGAIRLLVNRNRNVNWHLVASGAIALAIMLIEQVVLRSGLGQNFVEIQPWNKLYGIFQVFGLTGVQSISKPVWFFLFLILGLGVRVLGLLTLRSTVKQNPKARWLILYILLFFMSGYAIADVIYLGDSSYQFNHADWFAVQALFASWFLLFLFLSRLNSDKSSHALTLICLLLFSLPSTAQFLWLKIDSEVAVIGPDEQEVVEFLERTDPNSVVLHPLNIGAPSLASNLAGRSTVLSVSKSFVSETQGWSERLNTVRTFFDKDTESAVRKAILASHDVTYVYSPREFDELLASNNGLELVLSNDHYSVWKVILRMPAQIVE